MEEVVNMPLDDIVRDSAIQRFEYTFELSWKMLKLFLKEAFDNKDIEQDTFIEIIKKAAKHGLINNQEIWLEFRETRNYTSHAYSENNAKEAYFVAQKFLVEAKSLIAKLQEINQRLV